MIAANTNDKRLAGLSVAPRAILCRNIPAMRERAIEADMADPALFTAVHGISLNAHLAWLDTLEATCCIVERAA